MCTSLDARNNTTSLNAFGKNIAFSIFTNKFYFKFFLVVFLIQALKQTNAVTLRISHATGKALEILYCFAGDVEKYRCREVSSETFWYQIPVKVANHGDTPTQPSLKHTHDPALTHDLACKGTMSIFELVDVYLCEKSYWWFVCESP